MFKQSVYPELFIKCLFSSELKEPIIIKNLFPLVVQYQFTIEF